MRFHLSTTFAFLALTLVVCHAEMPLPEAYWNSVLPNTPMPEFILKLIPNEVGPAFYNHDAYDTYPNEEKKFLKYWRSYEATEKIIEDPTQVLFFLESALHPGTTMKYSLARIHKARATFLPRKIAETIPFSSAKLPQILNKFSVKPDSSEARIMKQAVEACEGRALEGEDRQCVTSLESMIDFATSNLGRDIQAVSTEVEKGATRLQNYTILASGVKKLADTGMDKLVLCHKISYGYAVFYCHYFGTTIRAYEVPLKGSDGTNAKAVAICHVDTSHWHPNSFAMQVLRIKPGTVPVCHLISEGEITWIQNRKPSSSWIDLSP